MSSAGSTLQQCQNQTRVVAINVQEMRQAYMPERIHLLLVAEAPPESPDRFFYNPFVTRHDSLFLETSKVLLPQLWEGRDARAVPSVKRSASEHLRDLGVFLVDAVDERLPQEMSDAQCAKRIRANAPAKVSEIAALLQERGAIDAVTVLVKGTVFSALAEPLRAYGIRVPQEGPIPFPASGGQRRFRETLLQIVAGERLAAPTSAPDAEHDGK